jgi:hypothetical protein
MDSAGRPSRVMLKTTGRYDEARAAVALKCGQMVKRTAAGKLTPHATAGGPGEKLWVTEDMNYLEGKTINDDYAVDQPVSFIKALAGDILFAFLLDGVSFLTGDALASNGNGSLKKANGTTDAVVAYMDDDLDLTGVGVVGDQRGKIAVA